MQDELTPRVAYWAGATVTALGTAIVLWGWRMISRQRQRGETSVGTAILIAFGATVAGVGLFMLVAGAVGFPPTN